MSIFEYDEEQTIRMIKQDEYRLGKEDGILLGREEGREQGILQSLCKLMSTLKLNASQAMDALDIPEEERAFYTAQMQKKS